MRFLIIVGRAFRRPIIGGFLLLLAGAWLEFFYLNGAEGLWTAIYDYQSILGALIAVFVAAITVAYLREQIDSQSREAKASQERRDDANSRRQKTVRAHLGDALSGLCEYIEQCQMYLMNDCTGQLPSRPIEDISVVKSAIEFVDSETADTMSTLGIKYQVFNARLSEEKLTIRENAGLQCFYDSMELRFHVDNLFYYARSRSEVAGPPTITKAAMKTKVLFIDIDSSLDGDLEDRLNKSIDQQFSSAG